MSPDIDPKADMSVHGWRKEKTFKYIDIQEDGRIKVEEFDFYTKDMSHSCGSNEYLWLSAQRSTMILVCTWCQTAEPIGRTFGRKREEYFITPKEAIALLVEKGYRRTDMPIRPYLKLLRKSKPQLLTKRKRPKD